MMTARSFHNRLRYAESNKPIGGQYGIRGFPTIKFFVDGKPMDFEGPRTSDGMSVIVSRVASVMAC